jgi:hypothetical protein
VPAAGTGGAQVADDVLVRVEQADPRHRQVGQPALAAGLAHEVLRPEDGLLVVVGPLRQRPLARSAHAATISLRVNVSGIRPATSSPDAAVRTATTQIAGRMPYASAIRPDSRAPTANPPSRHSR